MGTFPKVLLSGLLAYLAGSVSPAYILGRLIGGLDIREVNYRNAGTRNVRKTLGLLPAAVTAIVDTGKGIAALVVSEHLIGLTGYPLLVPVVMAVLGHIFPFMLKFRGGRGIATATGIVLFLMGRSMLAGVMPWTVFLGLLVTAGIVQLATRTGDITAIVAFTAMLIAVLIELGPAEERILAAVPLAYALVHSIVRGAELGVIRRSEHQDFIGWRVLLRPLAVLFIPLRILLPEAPFLTGLGVLAGMAMIVDGFRIAARRPMSEFFKSKERGRLSSITWFLVAVLLTYVLFEPRIADLSLAVLIFGDLGGKLIGMNYGRRTIVAGRTAEGSAGFFTCALIAGYTVSRIMGGPPLPMVLTGAAAAAAIELVSVGIDDNLTVALGTGGILTLLS